MTSVNDIRSAFLDFFEGHEHHVLPSSPLVPHNDPTLMFTNAGMVQFKNVFTGQEQRPYARAVTSQKCVRAGGKHNDLDNVGYTARHHTFFEMLGNFSFGDYFKEEAIEFAWLFLTREMGLEKDKLLATVYHDDDEAFNLWKKIAELPEDRIIRIATSDNFWAMGETGPCGPCSEIFYDHGSDIPGGPPGSPDEDGDRFIEIWNLVFMQFEQISWDNRINLPRPSIDTGMGLERIAAVLQGVHDNYDTDTFRTLIHGIEEESRNKPTPENHASFKVIADHLRSSCFLLADGVMPSNEGRGYVLRRIMRRAMRHAHHLGVKEPLMHRLVPYLVKEMGSAYPELYRAKALMTETLRLEEERFQRTLGRGLKLLEDEQQNLADNAALPGEVAFKLYDTYGFPLDLTQDILRQKGQTVDTEEFNRCMEEQKERARAAWSGSGDHATDALWFELRERLGPTEFLGYETESAEAQILAIVSGGDIVDAVEEDVDVAIITNQTPFYGESGGQVGDIGTLTTASGAVINITDTQKPFPDFHIHFGRVDSGMVESGGTASLTVNQEYRTKLRSNHSATHLLHQVLRNELGEHVTQKGSMVSADRLRFDISHPRAITAEELENIEREVNRLIRQNSKIRTVLTSPESAIEQGAMALFGEKYGDEVRVVTMGKEDDPNYSVELCGGTHVRRTGDIGVFKIVAESALAAGIRRIEALTGDEALAYLDGQDRELRRISAMMKTSVADLPERIEALQNERKKLEQELKEARRKLALGGGVAASDANATENIAGISFVGRLFDDVPARELKGVAEGFRKPLTSGVVAVVTREGGKASLVVGVTPDLAGKVDAVTLVRAGSAAVGGSGGGGRPDMAQAGGPDADKADDALDAIRAELSRLAQNAA